ncbi:unnamed protein product [Vitrella brassicaformis CCMP3155]|uniref:Uncharacterized protein n=1 Tax=Vitrella brassicaformis (strain CCMP3155) TaxID=1169540 RepID=A0A0G4FSY6_VITBC|nr:unnamed protein product [Vitrella brassicaformis CCMP3155]|eukprot:CEM17778.1 unnamed protein product [Vitrella brassicaformis CCMP3155]
MADLSRSPWTHRMCVLRTYFALSRTFYHVSFESEWPQFAPSRGTANPPNRGKARSRVTEVVRVGFGHTTRRYLLWLSHRTDHTPPGVSWLSCLGTCCVGITSVRTHPNHG